MESVQARIHSTAAGQFTLAALSCHAQCEERDNVTCISVEDLLLRRVSRRPDVVSVRRSAQSSM